MSRGLIYICWGEKAIREAEESMASLWQVAPGLPVFVVGDEAAEQHFRRQGKLAGFARPNVDPFQPDRAAGFQFLAGRVKPLLHGLSPFDETLYVDADSEFVASPALGFALLAKWDFVVAETETRSLANGIAGTRECHWTAKWLGTPHLLYHNSGMLFWRRNEATARLFALWAEEWQRFEGWDEQVALLRALLRSEALYLTVPHTWNCREGAKAVLLHHWFGTKKARQTVQRPAAQPRRPTRLIHVEIAPGRSVCCRPEEAEMYRERFAHLRMR